MQNNIIRKRIINIINRDVDCFMKNINKEKDLQELGSIIALCEQISNLRKRNKEIKDELEIKYKEFKKVIKEYKLL